MKKTSNPQDLQAIAKKVRREIVEMITEAKSGHPGGSLSAVEIVVTLFLDVLRHDPQNPKWPDRDHFLMSKGHGCPVLYSVMAECGYSFPDPLNSLRKLGSVFQGHPDVRFIPALEASTGSLGQGLSIGIGMALAAKLDRRPSRAYVVVGDGEIQEGQIWEAAMFAGDKHVDNLVCIVDYNRIQLDGFVDDIMPIEPVSDKWRSFNWHAIEVDGHDISKLQAAFSEAASTNGKPTAIIAHTVKGKGVSFMENNPKFHGVAPTREEMEKALVELA
jgi:transketolase